MHLEKEQSTIPGPPASFLRGDRSFPNKFVGSLLTPSATEVRFFLFQSAMYLFLLTDLVGDCNFRHSIEMPTVFRVIHPPKSLLLRSFNFPRDFIDFLSRDSFNPQFRRASNTRKILKLEIPPRRLCPNLRTVC